MLRRICNFKHVQKFENESEIMKSIYPKIAVDENLRNEVLKRFRMKTDEKYGWMTAVPDSDAYIAVDYTKCGYRLVSRTRRS